MSIASLFRRIALSSLVALAPTNIAAQDEEMPSLPTLGSIGLDGWSTPNGFIQLALSGRADLELYAPHGDPAWLIEETNEPFVVPRVRLFPDLFIGSMFYATAELRADMGEAESEHELQGRVEQAFVRFAPFEIVAVQAGKFASAFGSYPSLHHGPGDWFIRPPLMYEYRTLVSSEEVPLNATGWTGWKDRPEEFRPIGAPPVWAAPYQWGAMAFGVYRSLSWRAAWQNSAPSSEPEEWGWNDAATDRGNWIGAIGWRFAPWVKAEVSYSQGPYLQREVRGPVPGDADLAEFNQFIWGGELLFELAHTQVRGEVFHDTWQVPNVRTDPIDISWSVEARQELHPDLYVAGRVGQIRFSDVTVSAIGYDGLPVFGEEPWDYNVRRLQLAFGHRLATNAEIRAEFMGNETEGPHDPEDDLFSVQFWWAF